MFLNHVLLVFCALSLIVMIPRESRSHQFAYLKPAADVRNDINSLAPTRPDDIDNWYIMIDVYISHDVEVQRNGSRDFRLIVIAYCKIFISVIISVSYTRRVAIIITANKVLPIRVINQNHDVPQTAGIVFLLPTRSRPVSRGSFTEQKIRLVFESFFFFVSVTAFKNPRRIIDGRPSLVNYSQFKSPAF